VAKDQTVKVRIEAEDRASQTVHKVDAAFEDLTDGLSGRFVAATAAATAALAGVVSIMKDSIAAASESAAGIKQLDNALADLGPHGAEVSRGLQDQSAGLQKLTQFSDDAITKGQALAASFVKSEEALRQMTQAAADFAAGRGLDIGTAFDLLTKASQGSTETLTRYGIVLEEGIPKGERLAAVLAKINDKFGGRAVADAQTYAGAVEQVGNAYGEVLEAIGKLVTESDATNQTLRDTAAVLNAVADDASRAGGGSGLLGAALRTAGDAARDSIPYLGRFLEIFAAIQEARGAASKAEAEEASARDRALKSLREVTDEQVRTARNMTTLAEVLGTTTKAWNQLSAAEEREKRISGEVAETQDALGAAAERLGVTLQTNVLNAIEENNQALERFREGMRLGLVSQEEFIRAQQATEAANRALLGTTQEQSDAQTSANEAFRAGRRFAEDYASAVRSTVVPALQAAAEEASRTSALVQGVFDRSGRAIQGVIGFSQGGTRAELAGGGSRLVSSVGGTFGSQTRVSDGSSKTYIADPLTGRIERVG